MSRLRIVIAWLLMAALPLQGLAAATMLFCEGGHHEQSAEAAAAASHGHEHNHADASGHASSVKPLDAGHKCGICASCCYTVAIAQSMRSPSFAPLPQAGLAEPFVLIHTPPNRLPDKPPRA
jgi:hypothetical protein